MIINSFEDLAALRGKVAMVGGGFDPLHHGHLAYLEAAASFGLPLLVSVDNDQYIRRKHLPLLQHEQRCRVIDALKCVSHTFANPGTTAEVLAQLKPKIFFKGVEWQGCLPKEEEEICLRYGIEVKYLDTKMASSSDLLKSISQGEDQALAGFERLLQTQEMPKPDEYDKNYFASDWRVAGNEYTLENRRKIEGRHPEVIKEVFSPQKVVDMGCGPGFLMYLLNEVGIKADGVDISEEAVELAPPEIKGQIKLGSVMEVGLPDKSYDLVVCREVLEHLPVLDVMRAVQNMCRISSKYVYLTTRFHPSPASIFDVTDELHVDPTHITLMNKNMLRLMFVLSGFKRREDLENKIDWMGKGRVMVYERTEKAYL